MKHLITGTIFAASLGLAPVAAAQSHDFSHQGQNSVEMTAGFNFTMPLGQKRSGKVEDQARMGFRLGLTDNYETQTRPTTHYRSVDVLEAGFRLDGKPILLLSGQDIYTPLFTTLHADDKNSDKTDTTSGGISRNPGETVLIVVGVTAAAVLGAGLLIANEWEKEFR